MFIKVIMQFLQASSMLFARDYNFKFIAVQMLSHLLPELNQISGTKTDIYVESAAI
jgi:hypothetical protein